MALGEVTLCRSETNGIRVVNKGNLLSYVSKGLSTQSIKPMVTKMGLMKKNR